MTSASLRFGGVALVLAMAHAGCGPAQPDPQLVATAGSASASVVRAPQAPPSAYRFRVPASASSRTELSDGRLGLITQGNRVVVDAQGAVQWSSSDPRSYQRFVEGPPGPAGKKGYVFFTTDGLYTSETFDGDVRQIHVGQADSVSIGVGFALIIGSDGARTAIDLANGRPRTGLPLGAVKVAVGPSNRVGLIADGGRAYASTDGGATFSDLTKAHGVVASDVVGRAEGLFFLDALGNASRFDGSGVVPASVLPGPPSTVEPADPRWRGRTTPLERAIEVGAPWGEGQIIFAEQGSIYVVSSSTGAILEVEPGAVPPDLSCEATDLSDRVLFLCQANSAAAVYSRARGTKATELEKTLQGGAAFYRGRGDTLLYAGPCVTKTPPPSQGVACVRGARGWIDIDRSAELSDVPSGEPLRVTAWIPKDQGAYLVVGGKRGGIWDGATGQRSKLEDAEIAQLEPLFAGQKGLINDRFGVLDDGTIAGFGSDNVGFRVTEGGKKIERSPFRMNSPATAGARSLARASSGNRETLWLSTDSGWTYQEVAGPPLGADSPRNCSPAGCGLSSWLRVGWELETPTPRPPRAGFASSGTLPPAPIPTLKCTATGTSARKSSQTDIARNGFGAETVSVDRDFLALYTRGLHAPLVGAIESVNLRGAVTGPVPPEPVNDRPVVLSQSRRIRTVEPFDGKGTVNEQSVRLSDFADVIRSAGGTTVDPSATDSRGQGLVVGARDGDATVLLAGDLLPMVWTRGRDKPLLLSLGALVGTPQSGVRTGPDELAVLVGDDAGRLDVVSLGRGRADALFTFPSPPDGTIAATPDALAVDADGKLAVVRVSTMTAPTREQPALLLRPNAPPSALAPWSTLEADGTGACTGTDGWRAIIHSRVPWVRFGTTADDAFEPRLMIAKVRWSAQRVCLEAIEVPALMHDLPDGRQVESVIVAKFGKEPSAGHVMVAEGAELREPRTCALGPVGTER